MGFPARRYGWGWGPSGCGQGWVFLLGWLGVFYGGIYGLRADRHSARFAVHRVVMITVLLSVCLLQGETHGGYWGGK